MKLHIGPSLFVSVCSSPHFQNTETCIRYHLTLAIFWSAAGQNSVRILFTIDEAIGHHLSEFLQRGPPIPAVVNKYKAMLLAKLQETSKLPSRP